ncbi:hypothetical protein BaRGS_00003678 [Batillaria attramentaria]|uniref:Sulfhydryl oxidase n=1 Tax=Batillaria attramentaria TaxID=370345 RepID=A0ABD0M132_9CAEN
MLSSAVRVILLLVVCGLGHVDVEGKEGRNVKKEGLYSSEDDVIILNADNIKDRVNGKDRVWMIEFYNSWCGHCINFAPTYKSFAKDLLGWRRVVSVGAIDCAMEKNVPICREQDIGGYPSMKLFPPYFTGKVDSSIKTVTTQDKVEMKNAILDFITDPEFDIPSTWPRLQPIKNIAHILEEATEEHKFVVLVFEDEHSIVGREVILDLVDYPSILVRTMLKADVEKFGIIKYPSLYAINKDSSFKHLASGTGLIDADRRRFVDTLLSLIGMFDHNGKRIQVVPVKDGSDNNVVHFQQAEEQYFPGRKEVTHFLWKLVSNLEELESVLTGETWMELIDASQSKEAFLPERVKWTGCQGSQPRYRAVNAQEVPLAVRGYMKHFFGCEECSKNFLKMADNLENEIHKPLQAVVWLWSAHNRANKRLHGDISEDPDHPKIQFPSVSDCPQCHLEGKLGAVIDASQHPTWNMSAVGLFLLKFYSKDNIIQDVTEPGSATSVEQAGGAAGDKEMDWWEKKQREVDLKKIRGFREQKRKQRIEKLQKLTADDSAKDTGLSEVRSVAEQKLVRLEELEKSAKYKRGWGWAFSDLDIGVCMAFYVCCAAIILFLYYHFLVQRRYRIPCANYLPV